MAILLGKVAVAPAPSWTCLLAITTIVACSVQARPDVELALDQPKLLGRCELACGNGLDCLSTICTRSCSLSDGGAANCKGLAGAQCRTSAEPESAPLCDVSCTDPSECAFLGDDYDCEGGYCRAPAPRTQDCVAYRNSRGGSHLAIKLQNARDTAIFLKPYLRGCTDTPHLVQVSTRGREVDLQNPYLCSAASCQDLQDNVTLRDCPGVCSQARFVRLDPGAYLTLGTFRTQFLSHGLSPGTLPMPQQCTPRLAVGQRCLSEAPLDQGTYELVAQALPDCTIGSETGVAGSCDCQMSDSGGSCKTEAFATNPYDPLTAGLWAVASVDLSIQEATLVFH